MRWPMTILFLCVLVQVSAAGPLTSYRPPKSDAHIGQNPAYDREGGEAFATAIPIPGSPYSDTGMTCDNVDDYDAVCPYTGSTSPDVVYSLDLPTDANLTVDLCGSLYDTKVYVMDAAETVLACNDDFYFDSFCGFYVSKIEFAFIPGGQTVYIVIDGYGGDCGEYAVDVFYWPFGDCSLDCSGALPEGEPELMDGYQDSWNGGCNSPQFGNPFQDLWQGTGEFCGQSGWYQYAGNDYRDTDWFVVMFANDGDGIIGIEICAEQSTTLFELGPQDCGQVGVLQSVQVGPHIAGTLTLTGAPGDLAWIWVGPTTFTPPPGFTGHEYSYQLWFTGLETGDIATERATWSRVKGMYR